MAEAQTAQGMMKNLGAPHRRLLDAFGSGLVFALLLARRRVSI